MKECVHCNAEFEPSRKDKIYCTENCAMAFRSKRKRDRERAKLLPKKCLFCNKDVNRPRQYKYCSDKCHKAMRCKQVCDRAKEEVRENHAKKPPIHCKTCNVQLVTTVRNYHQIEFCPPCRKIQDRKRSNDFFEENKERLRTYFKENHAKKMQDPEYKKQHNERSRLRRLSEPKTFVDCLVCGKNFPRSRYNKNCSKKCSKLWEWKKQNTPAAIMSKNLARQLHRAIKLKNTNWSRGMDLEGNVWVHFSFTIDEFREHFESLFTKGMTWGNMGLWHIDHIKPKASFNQEQLADPTSEDFKKCWALNNLQPLWAADNIRKGDK